MLPYVGFGPFSEKKYKKILDVMKCMHILAALILVHKTFLKLNTKQKLYEKNYPIIDSCCRYTFGN